jgi:hypothetical protein
MKNDRAIKFLALTACLGLMVICAGASDRPAKGPGIHLSAKLISKTKLEYRIANTDGPVAVVPIMSCSKMDNWETGNPEASIIGRAFAVATRTHANGKP